MPGLDLKTLVQNIGQSVSLHLFTENVLRTSLGKSFYLFLYAGFKRLFEEKEWRELDRYLVTGSTVLDIGANVGMTAAYFSKKVGPNGHVVAFEPDPLMADLCRTYLTKRRLTNVDLIATALGAEDGMHIFFQNLSNRADNRLVFDAEGMGTTRQVAVPIRSLSSLAKEDSKRFTEVSLVKIDVQGYEFWVLSGMTAWIKSLTKKPIIHMEFWPYGLKRAGSSPEELLALAHSLGYLVPADAFKLSQDMEKTKAYADITLLPSS